MTDTEPRPPQLRSYMIHPLSALDGVLLHVTLNGESVGFYFGADEQAAARSAAAELVHSVSSDTQ